MDLSYTDRNHRKQYPVQDMFSTPCIYAEGKVDHASQPQKNETEFQELPVVVSPHQKITSSLGRTASREAPQ